MILLVIIVTLWINFLSSNDKYPMIFNLKLRILLPLKSIHIMNNFDDKHIKNLAFVGAHKSGKTTLVETMLFEAGLLNRRGSIEGKKTVSDYHEIEKVLVYSNGHRCCFARFTPTTGSCCSTIY